MPEPMKPSELEKAVKAVSSFPEPDAEFLHSLRARFIAEGHASAIQPQENSMKNRKLISRLAWGLAVLALALSATNPIVVNALKRLFGYVPNVGIIDRSAQVMILSEPVTSTRDGFALTVEQAVLSNETLTIVYAYTAPADFLFIPDPRGMFGDAPYVLLPDGTRVDILAGKQVSTADCPQCSMRYAMDFATIPNGTQAVTLQLPTLVAMQVGVAPENWSIPLELRLAGPDDIAPVIEVEFTPQPTPTQARPGAWCSSPHTLVAHPADATRCCATAASPPTRRPARNISISTIRSMTGRALKAPSGS